MQDQIQPVNHSWWTHYPVKKDWAAIGVILLLATFLRFHGLNEPGLWLDEVSYTFAAQKPIIDQITNPSDTLGGYLSVDPTLSALPFSLSLKLGFSNFLARFPAAIFGVLGVALIYRVGRTLFGNRVALTAALLLSTSSFHILYSQEARSYAQFVFFVLASYLFLYRAFTRNRFTNWMLYAVFTWTELPDRWYVFYEARNIPARWQKELSYREFYDILVVHLPGRCPIDRCLHEATGLLSEAAQANPGSALEQKVKLMLSGLSNLAAH